MAPAAFLDPSGAVIPEHLENPPFCGIVSDVVFEVSDVEAHQLQNNLPTWDGSQSDYSFIVDAAIGA